MTIHIELVGDDRVEVVAGDIADFIGHFSEHLSREGVFLETDLALDRGRELQLSMRLEDGFVLVRGSVMVAWQRQQRADSSIRSGVAMHLLEIAEGSEFLERLVREHESSGGLAFTVDRDAPLTDDGGPLPPDALDQMMTQHGDLRAIAELKDVVVAQDREVDLDENAPEFAPGFGKADSWDSEVGLEIPGQVNNWLQQQSVSPLPPAASPASASPPAAPTHVTERPDVQQPLAAPQQPLAASVRGLANRGQAADQPAEEPKVRRSGPIKMKLAADRQPDSSPSFQAQVPAREPTQSSSFVEASRRVTELMGEGSRTRMKPMVPSSSGSVTGAVRGSSQSRAEDPTLATVAIKPGELANMLERQAAAHAASSQGRAENAKRESSRVGEPLVRSAVGATESGAASAFADQTLVTKPSDAGEPSSSNKSELVIDPEVMGEADSVSGYGYPEEDRTPMLIIGVLVAVIVIALVVWSLVF